MKILIFLSVILAILTLKGVAAETDSSLSMDELLMVKMNNMVEIYNEQLDKKVQWNVLNDCLETIGALFKNYEGKAKRHMQSILEENVQSHDEYVFAVGPLFQWCGVVKYDCPRIVSIIKRPNLPDRTRKYIKTRSEELLLKGVNRSRDSIAHIERAIQHMSRLGVLLNVTKIELDADFSSNGYYGIKRQDFENEIQRQRELKELAERNRRKRFIISFLGLICTAILGFVAGPVGVTFGLRTTLELANIPIPVIDGTIIPTLEQQIKIIDVFYEELEVALIRAQQECQKIDAALKIEYKDINQLASDIQTPKPDDLEFPEFSDTFVGAMNKLSDSCKKYVESHRSTPSRKRRGTVSQKIEMEPSDDASLLLNEGYGIMQKAVSANFIKFVSVPYLSQV